MTSLYTSCRLYFNLFFNNNNEFVGSVSIKSNNTLILIPIIYCIFILTFVLALMLSPIIRLLLADKLVFNNKLFKQYASTHY